MPIIKPVTNSLTDLTNKGNRIRYVLAGQVWTPLLCLFLTWDDVLEPGWVHGHIQESLNMVTIHGHTVTYMLNTVMSNVYSSVRYKHFNRGTTAIPPLHNSKI